MLGVGGVVLLAGGGTEGYDGRLRLRVEEVAGAVDAGAAGLEDELLARDCIFFGR